MADQSKPIQVGSIIHLKNGLPDGGYLDTRGRVVDKPAFWNVAGTERVFVSTHGSPDRDRGSGSWQVVSAEGKPEGEPLQSGDTIHLRSMYPDAGFLDCCGWVEHLPPFAAYQAEVTCGIFTTGLPDRDNGTGKWTVRAISPTGDERAAGQPLLDGDVIRLENGYPAVENGHPKTGFLVARGKVTELEVFKEYAGQLALVFTHRIAAPTDKSYAWTVTLNIPVDESSERAKNVYYAWGYEAGKWADLGVFHLQDRSGQSVVALNVPLNNGGETLTGTITYKDPIDFTATPTAQGGYEVKTQSGSPSGADATWEKVGAWMLGSRTHIAAIAIRSADGGRTFSGTITYAGKEPIDFKGLRATQTLVDGKQVTLLYDFFKVSLWEVRTQRISEALDATVTELNSLLATIGAQNLPEITDNTKAESDLFNKLNEALSALLTQTPPDDAVDFAYQATQLFNIYTLWLTMRMFWKKLRETSIDAINELTKVGMLPPVHQIRACFQQFTTDFEIVQRAIQQRQWIETPKTATPKTDTPSTGATSKGVHASTQAKSLVVTDKLATMALAPFAHLVSDAAHVVPITYFSETIHIRQLPYTDQFVLVGLTYDLTSPLRHSLQEEQEDSPAFELMAIPHEVGHFMYHNARIKAMVKVKNLAGDSHIGAEMVTFADICAQFKDYPFAQWCEEIFADLYGCVVAGPFAALGLQVLLATSDKERVLLDDEEHPTPLLRPFLLSEMLRILSDKKPERYNFSEIAQNLDANWTAILERWGFVMEGVNNSRPARIMLPVKHGAYLGAFIHVDEMMNEVGEIIKTLADILLEYAQFDPWVADSNKNELSATISWCNEQRSVAKCVEEIKNLSGKSVAGKKVPQRQLSQDELNKFRTAITAKLDAIFAANHQDLEATLARNVLGKWGDSGPTGSSGGTHLVSILPFALVI